MKTYGVLDNASVVNQFMTNEKVIFHLNSLEMNILWFSCPVATDSAAKQTGSMPKTHSHSFCETHFCTVGSMMFRLADGREYTVRAGELIFIRENVLHTCIYLVDGTERISLAYRLTDGHSVYNRPESAQLTDVFVLSDADDVFSAYKLLSEEIANRRVGYREIIGTILLREVMKFERHISTDSDAGRFIPRIDKRVDEIMVFIEANLSHNITTVSVAESLHLSKRQINRIVYKEMGISCTNLIKDVKHKKAQEMLIYSDDSIQDIAGALGYGNVFSFSKFFKSKEGMPPALFRRSHYAY